MNTNYLAHYGVKGMKWTKKGTPRYGLRSTSTARGTRNSYASGAKTSGKNLPKRYARDPEKDSPNGSKAAPSRGTNTHRTKSRKHMVYAADLHGGHWVSTIKGTRWNQPWGPTKQRYPEAHQPSGLSTSVGRRGSRTNKSRGTVTNSFTGRTIKGNRMNTSMWGRKENTPHNSRTTSYRTNAVRSGYRSNTSRAVYGALSRLRNGRQRNAGRQK